MEWYTNVRILWGKDGTSEDTEHKAEPFKSNMGQYKTGRKSEYAQCVITQLIEKLFSSLISGKFSFSDKQCLCSSLDNYLAFYYNKDYCLKTDLVFCSVCIYLVIFSKLFFFTQKFSCSNHLFSVLVRSSNSCSSLSLMFLSVYCYSTWL